MNAKRVETPGTPPNDPPLEWPEAGFFIYALATLIVVVLSAPVVLANAFALMVLWSVYTPYWGTETQLTWVGALGAACIARVLTYHVRGRDANRKTSWREIWLAMFSGVMSAFIFLLLGLGLWWIFG